MGHGIHQYSARSGRKVEVIYIYTVGTPTRHQYIPPKHLFFPNVQLSSSKFHENRRLNTAENRPAEATPAANQSIRLTMSINLILPHSSTVDAIAPKIPIKMIPLRRPASRILSRLSRSQQRRLASTEGEGIGGRQDISSGHADSAGQAHPTSHGHHPEPVNESLGRGFYLTLAALPASFALYKLSRPSDDSTDPASQPWLTRVIHSYDHWRDEWESRNTLHTAAIEQAAHDRHLFHGTKGSHVIELRFPEYVAPFSLSLEAVPSLPSH